MARWRRVKREDRIGERYGKLVAVSVSDEKCKLILLCDCGNTKEMSVGHLHKNSSCGCSSWDRVAQERGTHGLCRANAPTHRSWMKMRRRCNNPLDPAYSYYGGRGITVCERWESFSNFLEDMGEKLPGTSIDRIDNNDGYYKENCRWATSQEQNRNKRNNLIVDWEGRRVAVSEIAHLAPVSVAQVYLRLKRGMTIQEAIMTPHQRPPRGKK